MSGILGKKLGMSQLVDEGTMVPVTYVVCEPNTVFQKRTEEKDGYNAVVLGFEPLKKPTKTKKFKKLKEFSFDEDLNLNDQVKVGIFEKDDLVTVRGTSKGKGFQGRIRRHNASISRESHGTKYTRHGSSGGQCAMPGRNKPGTRMAGHMGCDTVSLKKCQIMLVDEKKNLIAVKGSVPGAINSLVIIEK